MPPCDSNLFPYKLWINFCFNRGCHALWCYWRLCQWTLLRPSIIVAVCHSMQNSGGCLWNKRLPDTVFVRSSIGQAATRTVPAPRGGTVPYMLCVIPHLTAELIAGHCNIYMATYQFNVSSLQRGIPETQHILPVLKRWVKLLFRNHFCHLLSCISLWIYAVFFQGGVI